MKPRRRRYTRPGDSLELLTAPLLWLAGRIERWLARRRKKD